MTLSETLRSRGFVNQFSSETLEEITDGPHRTVYLGVDPTADSIHVGNLAVYMLLKHFAEAGHKIILLFGGGTGRIGDPKPDVERSLTDDITIRERIEKLRTQAEQLLGGSSITIVNNADWLERLSLIDFLRDTGKYFTVNNLVKKDAISARMKSEDGISFTEFSYPLLQAHDFWHLFKKLRCDVQVGGSDQWGNIISGVELIRRKENAPAYALTIPLITDKVSGKKFGKSEGNAVWLDPEKTSPYAFYQFWFNVSDENVDSFLKIFTMLQMNEIDAALELHNRDTKYRRAQKILALEATTLVHGERAAKAAEQISEVFFGDTSLHSLSPGTIEQLLREAPSCKIEEGMTILDALVNSLLASSKREARQFISDEAVSLNDEVIADEKRTLARTDFFNNVALLKRGKRSVCVLVLG